MLFRFHGNIEPWFHALLVARTYCTHIPEINNRAIRVDSSKLGKFYTNGVRSNTPDNASTDAYLVVCTKYKVWLKTISSIHSSVQCHQLKTGYSLPRTGLDDPHNSRDMTCDCTYDTPRMFRNNLVGQAQEMSVDKL